jgi:type IV pilus assembly protein PilN
LKPIHLNLASRPFRDYRPVYAVVVVASLLAAFLMLNNIDTYYRYIRDTKSTRAEIERIETQAQEERRGEQAARQRLTRIDLGHLDDQSRFVNAKLAERAFSWSNLLDDLEGVLADDVRLNSVAPSFGKDGSVDLSLEFTSKSGDGMITTINRMNRNPRFGSPFPKSEVVVEGGYQFVLSAHYIPRGPRVAILRAGAVPTAGARR